MRVECEGGEHVRRMGEEHIQMRLREMTNTVGVRMEDE